MESQLRSPRRSRPNIGAELSVEGDWAPRARVVGRPSHAEIPIAPRLLVFLQLIDADGDFGTHKYPVSLVSSSSPRRRRVRLGCPRLERHRRH